MRAADEAQQAMMMIQKRRRMRLLGRSTSCAKNLLQCKVSYKGCSTS
jgi:hypothetical protein